MYCKYCGKYVLGERDICDECLAKQNQAQPVDQTTGTVFFVFAVLLTLITIAANVNTLLFNGIIITAYLSAL